MFFAVFGYENKNKTILIIWTLLDGPEIKVLIGETSHDRAWCQFPAAWEDGIFVLPPPRLLLFPRFIGSLWSWCWTSFKWVTSSAPWLTSFLWSFSCHLLKLFLCFVQLTDWCCNLANFPFKWEFLPPNILRMWFPNTSCVTHWGSHWPVIYY